MNVYFTSDHHFGHTNIIKYEQRPFASVEHMNEHMIQMWNSIVKPEDMVYHLGDFALTKKDHIKPLLMRLNGHKHLILGNHDRSAKFMMECGFLSAEKYNMIFQEGKTIGMIHDPAKIISRPIHCDILLYGHVHGKKKLWDNSGKMIHVGVDSWDYRPVSLEEIIQLVKRGVGLPLFN